MKDAAWHLVRYVLQHASDYPWKRDSNKISVRLPDGVAINVFDSRYCHPDGKTVHSHPFDFRSRIIAGVMRQRLYATSSAAEKLARRYVCRAFDADFRPDASVPPDAWL